MNEQFSGAYINANSTVHRLDSRIKLLCFVLALAFTLASNGVLMYLINLAVLIICAKLSKIKISYLLASLKRVWLFALIILVMNALFYDGSKQIFYMITEEGISKGFHIALNIVFIFLWSGILLSVTSPMQMMDAIGFYLKPLKYVGVKVDGITLIISVAIQFIPILLSEASNIKKAQTARGAEFESKNLFKKAKSILPLVVPIFVSAFKRADEMAQALEARGYTGGL
ncbi:MAG: energy-coupling factor transporter transmembrane component T family protein [Eubacterium sp.]